MRAKRLWYWTSLSLFFSLSLSAQDAAKEEYLFNIYKKYHSQPTSRDLWEGALAQRQAREYSMVKGDTLWDMSKTLFGDGFFWSKIWSLNPFITNPHEISVGQVIHFYPGTGLDSPGLQMTTTSATPVLTSKTPISETKWWLSQDFPTIPIDLTGVQIPPPLRRYPPALETFPPSLPNWRFMTDPGSKEDPIEILDPVRTEVVNILNLPYFISEYPPNVMGEIYEIEKDATTASDRDFVFIDAENDLKIGGTYTAIQEIGAIRDPDAMGDTPSSYEVQGELIIVGKVEDYYKAQVKQALFPVRVGAILIPGPCPKMDMSTPGVLGKFKAMIIGGESDVSRSLFGPQSIVFINRGSADGVKVNQRSIIRAAHRIRHSESDIYENSWPIGEIKVIKVEQNYSTAVVITATEGILPGDFVGKIDGSDLSETYKHIDDSTSFGDEDNSSFLRAKDKTFRSKRKGNSDDDLEEFSPDHAEDSSSSSGADELEDSSSGDSSDSEEFSDLEEGVSEPEAEDPSPKSKKSDGEGEDALTDDEFGN